MKLLKWIRDTYIESEEQADEAADKQFAEVQVQLSNVSLEKRLLCAVAAPLRVVTFGEWFTMLKSGTKNEKHVPIHLHTFGDELSLSTEQKSKLKESLTKTYQVVDRTSALFMCEEIRNSNWKVIKEKVDALDFDTNEIRMLYFQQTEIGAWYAMLLAMTGDSLTACVDLGYLTEEETLALVEEMMVYLPLVFDDWEEFSKRFIEGYKLSKLNYPIGTRVLKKYLVHLQTKSGSPWQWLPMSEISQMKWQSRTTKR